MNSFSATFIVENMSEREGRNRSLALGFSFKSTCIFRRFSSVVLNTLEEVLISADYSLTQCLTEVFTALVSLVYALLLQATSKTYEQLPFVRHFITLNFFSEEKDYRVTLYYTVIEIANEFGTQYVTDTCGISAIIACMIFGIYRTKGRKSQMTS